MNLIKSLPKNLNKSIIISIDVFEKCRMSGKYGWPRSDATFCTVWSESTLLFLCMPVSEYSVITLTSGFKKHDTDTLVEFQIL